MNNGLRKAFGAVLIIVSALLGLTFLQTMLAFISMPWCIIGLIICLSVIFVVLFYNKLKTKRPIRLLLNVYIGALVIGSIYIGTLSVFIISASMNTPQAAVAAGTFSSETPQTVIVLGCQTINGYPSEMLKARLDKAAEYMNENAAAVCIVSGGKGDNEIEPESVTMKSYLITKGISETRIYTEEKSRNTQQNLAFSYEIIEKTGLPRDVVVVSEGYHLYRAQRQAEKLGLSAFTLPADSHDAWYALPSCWLRECIAITRDYAAELFG